MVDKHDVDTLTHTRSHTRSNSHSHKQGTEKNNRERNERKCHTVPNKYLGFKKKKEVNENEVDLNNNRSLSETRDRKKL